MSADMSTLQSVILIDQQGILSAKSGPNTLVVEVLAGESVISIKQIRQLIGWLMQFGYQEGAKQGIILQAERWHHTAPEALLKSLEEPVADTTIILTTRHPTALPATIRSRCAIIALEDVPEAQLAAWGLFRQTVAGPDLPLTWSEFSNLAIADKWLTMEPWFKTVDWAAQLRQWESDLVTQLQSPKGLSPQHLVRQLAAVHQARQDLRGHVLPRLAIDQLVLELDASGSSGA